MNNFSLLVQIRRLETKIKDLEYALAQATANQVKVFVGSTPPQNVVTAAGPAIYMQTDTVPPTLYFKTSSGISNNEWQ